MATNSPPPPPGYLSFEKKKNDGCVLVALSGSIWPEAALTPPNGALYIDTHTRTISCLSQILSLQNNTTHTHVLGPLTNHLTLVELGYCSTGTFSI